MITAIKDRAARALIALGERVGGYIEECDETYSFDLDEADMSPEEIAQLHADKGWQYPSLGGCPSAEEVANIEESAAAHMAENPDEPSYAVGRVMAFRHSEMPNTIVLALWVASVDIEADDEDEYEESE